MAQTYYSSMEKFKDSHPDAIKVITFRQPHTYVTYYFVGDDIWFITHTEKGPTSGFYLNKVNNFEVAMTYNSQFPYEMHL